MRERFAKSVKLRATRTEFEGNYHNGPMEAEKFEPSRALLATDIEEWHGQFQTVDADHEDVVGAEPDAEARIIAPREAGDDLWQYTQVWDELLCEWDFAVIKRSAKCFKLRQNNPVGVTIIVRFPFLMRAPTGTVPRSHRVMR